MATITDITILKQKVGKLMEYGSYIFEGYRTGKHHFRLDFHKNPVGGLRDDNVRSQSVTIHQDSRGTGIRSFPMRIEQRCNLLLDKNNTPLENTNLFPTLVAKEILKFRTLIEEIRGLNRRYSHKGMLLCAESLKLDETLRKEYSTRIKGADAWGISYQQGQVVQISRREEIALKKKIGEMTAHYQEVLSYVKQAIEYVDKLDKKVRGPSPFKRFSYRVGNWLSNFFRN